MLLLVGEVALGTPGFVVDNLVHFLVAGHVALFFISPLDSLHDVIREFLLRLAFVGVGHHFLTDDFVVLIFLVKVDFQVILIRVDLVRQLRLFHDVPDKLEVVQEQQELPHHPNHRQEEGT